MRGKEAIKDWVMELDRLDLGLGGGREADRCCRRLYRQGVGFVRVFPLGLPLLSLSHLFLL